MSTIDNVADVSVSAPVDGSVRRRKRGKGRPKHAVTHTVLDREVLHTAKMLIFAGSYTRYEIVSETEAVVR